MIYKLATSVLEIDFKWFPIALIIAYIPFHLLEEAFGNFPLWMSEHYNLPSALSYPHWLINNLFFLFTLLTGFFIYSRNREKNMIFGIGILFWGFMNSMEHIVFSIADSKLSPGIFSSFLFLTIFIMGMVKVYQMGGIKNKLILSSIAVAIGYWVIPTLIIISLGSSIKGLFP